MKRVYTHLHEPEKYPEYHLRAAKAVTRAALDNRIQFTSLRSFPIDDGREEVGVQTDTGAMALPEQSKTRLKEIRETIDMYVDHFRLGKVLWPVYPTLFADNLEEMVRICKERGLYLYDFWGFVPGSNPKTGIWGEYTIPASADACMREILGDHFLGYDNGEQDGRYIHSQAMRTAPLDESRTAQYKVFQAYFEKLNDSMLNNTVTLSSLTFLPYFAKEGNTIMLGAETAQALPSSVMWFSFIRGAAKQYGLLYYGNASVWNRWGYKDYNWEETDTSMGYEAGRYAGTSLSLLRRLIYNQYMYNCDILGFEGGWMITEKAEEGDTTNDDQYIMGDKRYRFTPIGQLQRYCADFVRSHGTPGILYTPLALITDFHAGWVPPRHLYCPDIYKTWGNLPYRSGDHQLDLLFGMMYPGYERAGFFRDESGFATATPYGEIADVLLSDVRSQVLERYAAAIVCNDTPMTLEFFRKLKDYVARGGKLLVFRGLVESGASLAARDSDYCAFFGMDSGANEIAWGKGSVTVVQESDGLVPTGETAYTNETNGDIPHPYCFSDEAFAALDSFMRPLSILRPNNPALQYCLDIRDKDHYTLFVANNSLSTETFDIVADEGEIAEIKPIPIEDGIPGLPEFLPFGFKDAMAPTFGTGAYTIGAGDCLLFEVTARGIALEEREEAYPDAPNRERYLSLAGWKGSAKGFLLDHPTFAHHFGGIMLPASYFEAMSEEAAAREAHYFRLQNIRVAVDFTALMNHYPDISIIDNFADRTADAQARVERTLRLAAAYGCTFAVFTGTRNAENEWTPAMALEGAAKNLRAFAEMGKKYGIRCVLQNRHLDISAAEQYSLAVDAGMETALNTAYAAFESEPISVEGKALVLLSSAMRDLFGQVYKTNRPCAGSPDGENLREACARAAAAGIPVVLCGSFADWDDVTAELEFLR